MYLRPADLVTVPAGLPDTHQNLTPQELCDKLLLVRSTHLTIAGILSVPQRVDMACLRYCCHCSGPAVSAVHLPATRVASLLPHQCVVRSLRPPMTASLSKQYSISTCHTECAPCCSSDNWPPCSTCVSGTCWSAGGGVGVGELVGGRFSCCCAAPADP